MKQVVALVTIFIASAIALAAQDTTHKDIIGTYKFPAGSVIADVTVAQENGTFTMSSSAGNSPLELIKGDTFNIVNFNGFAVFKRNESKKFNAVHIEASGYTLDGVKDEATKLTSTKIDDLSAVKEKLFALRLRKKPFLALVYN